MFSQVFLAATAREMEILLPKKAAYMACHFSAGGDGLSNIPHNLPQGSILLLDDSTPVQGHSPVTVVAQLRELESKFHLLAILLDFQREVTKEAIEMAAAILQNCKGAITPAYAGALGCGVFLPPPPVNKPLLQHIKPWSGREIFLEIAPEAAEFVLTEDGCKVSAVLPADLPLQDMRLHCHYGVTVFPDRAVFTIGRNQEDLAALVQEATALGISQLIGLYQELYT